MATDNKLIDNYTQNIGTVTDSRGREVHRLQLKLQDHKDSTGYALYTDATFSIVDIESEKTVSSYKIQNQGLFTQPQNSKNRDVIIPLAAQPELLRGIVTIVKNARYYQETIKTYRDKIYRLQDEVGLLRQELEQAQHKLIEAGIKIEQPKKAAKAPPKKKSAQAMPNIAAGLEVLNVTTAEWPPAGFRLTDAAARVNRGTLQGYVPTYWDPFAPAVEQAPAPNEPEHEPEANDPF